MNYFLKIPIAYENDLADLRSWMHLKVAFEKEWVWIANLQQEQTEAADVMRIPFVEVYYEEQNQLFRMGSKLPSQLTPSLLWTPIQHAFQLTLPKMNQHYFGLKQEVSIRIVAADHGQEPEMQHLSMSSLNDYVETAPQIRLSPLKWVSVNKESCLILGTPMLPLNAKVYWNSQGMYLPVGYDFEFPVLAKEIKKKLSEDPDQMVVWDEDGCYFFLDRSLFGPLSRSSVRKTVKSTKRDQASNVS